MTTSLAGYIQQERIKQRLNYAELSRLMGYQNINRGMRRILALERENEPHPEILEKVVKVLQLDQGLVKELIQQDEEREVSDFEEWASTPIKWHLVVRWMPAVYVTRALPEHIKTEDEALNYAKTFATKKKLMVWLVLSRRENIHIDGKATSYDVTQDFTNLPFMKL